MFVACISLVLGIKEQSGFGNTMCTCVCVCVNVLVYEVGCTECVWLLFLCIYLCIWGQCPAVCYPGHTILSSFLYLYVCICVCVCVCLCLHVVVSLVITICVSLTVWSGKAPRPPARSVLCWNPGSTVCLTP